jgi:hypothetical protein
MEAMENLEGERGHRNPEAALSGQAHISRHISFALYCVKLLSKLPRMHEEI